MPKQYPYHFWQIHKKVYNREWNMLEWYVRKQVLADCEGDVAKEFHKFVMEVALEFFADGDHNYNSRHRFQYNQ